ncbi:hypothetical protein [Minisyncoccus archaeiphilus]
MIFPVTMKEIDCEQECWKCLDFECPEHNGFVASNPPPTKKKKKQKAR